MITFACSDHLLVHVSETMLTTDDSKVPCTGCKGTGFMGARCSDCATGAVLAQRVLIMEIATDARAADDERAKVPQKRISIKKDTPGLRGSQTRTDTQAKETMDKNVSDGEVETSGEE